MIPRRVLIVCLLAGMLVSNLAAQEAERGRAARKRWIVSAVVLVAANFADGFSSRGAAEANPLLRKPGGAFSGNRALAAKSCLTGGAFAIQWALLRHKPSDSAFNTATVANFAAAGAVSAIAVRNLRTQTGPSAAP